jgi:hypothetical protein
MAQQQTPNHPNETGMKEEVEVEEGSEEGGRRKSIYRERVRVGVDGEELGFGFGLSQDREDEDDDDDDDDEEDEPDFYSLPLIPIGHMGSSFSSTQGPLVSSYLPSADTQQIADSSVPSLRGKSGRGRMRYSSLPAGSSRSIDRGLKLGTVVEDEEEEDVDRNVGQGFSTVSISPSILGDSFGSSWS